MTKSKVQESSPNNKELIKPIEEEKPLPEIKPIKPKLIKSDMSEKRKDEIFEYLEKLDKRIPPAMLVRGLNGFLTDNYEKGWSIFIGSNYYGLCSYEEDCYLEFEAVGFRIILFKTFCPT